MKKKGFRVFFYFFPATEWFWHTMMAPGEWGGGGVSLQSLVCAFKHENGVGDLEGGSQLDAHDLHDVGLGQQQEGLTVNHLTTQER